MDKLRVCLKKSTSTPTKLISRWIECCYGNNQEFNVKIIGELDIEDLKKLILRNFYETLQKQPTPQQTEKWYCENWIFHNNFGDTLKNPTSSNNITIVELFYLKIK